MKEKIIAMLLGSIDFNKLVASAVDGKVTKEELSGAIQFEGLADGILDTIVEPALQKVVDSTENPYDNQFKAIFYPIVAKEVKELIDEKVGNNDGQ